jgi:hypothetical protein
VADGVVPHGRRGLRGGGQHGRAVGRRAARRGAAMPHGRSEQGRGREADRWGQVAQCRSVRVKRYSNRFKTI